jgi:hypothetical protein
MNTFMVASVVKLSVHIGALIVLCFLFAALSTTQATTPASANTQAATVAGQCPEPRETERAPDSYYNRTNPLKKTSENLTKGRLLYEQDGKPLPCADCHGKNGDGRGPLGKGLAPVPRNFACAETMSSLSDGQLYWVIESGSGEFHLPSEQGAQRIKRPGRRTQFTAMRAHKGYLTDIEIWQLILYIRTLV